MSASSYTPPKVWQWEKASGGKFEKINRPVADPTHEQELPLGKHPLQLYSLGTPNGQKATIMLEELLAAGCPEAEYDAWLIDISEGEQFGSGFIAVNPNAKIPVLVDHSGDRPLRIFESGSILLYLAEKFGRFLPTDINDRSECLNWLFWQMGASPFLGGGFGHFYRYAPEPMEYPIDRYTMEVKRQLHVLDRHLADNEYLAGDDYTIADISIWPWYGGVVSGNVYDAVEFLQAESYTHVLRWAKIIASRPAVQRGRIVNRTWGPPERQLHERHSAEDFDTRTQDKLGHKQGRQSLV